MAPLASEPRHLLLVLNPAKRKALYNLIAEITQWMRSQRQDSPASENASPGLTQLRNAALQYFDAWKKDTLTKLKEILAAPDDSAILDARRKRTDAVAQKRAQAKASRPSDDLIDLGEPLQGSVDLDDDVGDKEAAARLQALYHPISTRLTTISYEDRTETLSAVLLLLLSTGHYPAESRVLAVYLASALELPLSALDNEEVEIATSLVTSSSEAAKSGTGMSAEAEAQKRRQDGQAGRYWKVGLASVAGAAIIGVTGGLAAPVVAGAIGGLMGSVGLGGVASFLGIFWMNGALVGTLFGALGARMTGEAVDKYAREVEDFAFVPVHEQPPTSQQQPPDRLRLTVGVNGWLTSEASITAPWRHLPPTTEVFALRYETRALLALGASLKNLYAWSALKLHLLRHTVLATLAAALWPAYLVTTAASTIDNPFSLARNRSDKAGAVLADALANRVQGHRPVTLIGVSLGARVVHACLRELARRREFGIVETVVFIGAPVPSDAKSWEGVRAVVAGRVVNVYEEGDGVLGLMYRAASAQLGVAGLEAVEGVGNVDLSGVVEGHLGYPRMMGEVLKRCGFDVVAGVEEEGVVEERVVVRDDGGGRLVELDMLSFEDAPLGRPGAGGGSVSMPVVPKAVVGVSVPAVSSKQRGTVVRAATATVSGDGDPLSGSGPLGGPLGGPAPARQPPLFRANTVPTPGSGMGPTAPLFADPSARPKDQGVRPGIMEAPVERSEMSAASPKAKDPLPVVPPHHDGANSDEEDGFGIKMVDNDGHSDAGSFTYVDPVPIED